MIKNCLFLGILFFSLLSCEEQMVIIPDGPGPIDTTQEVKRVVLFEELTGVSCAPCFNGAAVVEDLSSFFGDQLVINGIHGSFQANPTSASKYDFRYEDSRALENSFVFLGKPSAVIDRVMFSDQDFQAIDVTGLWQSKIQERLSVPVKVKLESEVSYNAATRTSTLTLNIEALEDLPGTIKLHVLVNESKLVDAQLSVEFGLVEDFEHKHVMKEMLSSVQGDILDSDISASATFPRTYSYTVPPEVNGEWIPENMEFIYYVTAADEDNTVLQAGAIHIN